MAESATSNVNDLPSTMDDVENISGPTRILVLGKSGVGKSSLIRVIFGFDDEGGDEAAPKASMFQAGVSDIEREFCPKENPRLHFHDSEGYEAGDVDKFNAVQQFITRRTEQTVDTNQKLHAVWLCIATPNAGSRLKQTGDEKIFKLCTERKVPIVLVFTKYDLLVSSKEFEILKKNSQIALAEKEQLAKKRAEASFKADCRDFISLAKKHNFPCVKTSRDRSTAEELINQTIQYLSSRPQRGVSRFFGSTLFTKFSSRPNSETEAIGDNEAEVIMMASAQRIAVDPKIEYCIVLGEKRYWGSLSSAVHFKGDALTRCLFVIYMDIVRFWNIREEAPHYILSADFVGEMTRLVEDLNTSNGPTASSGIVATATKVASPATTAASMIASTAAPAAYITLPIIVGLVLAKWVYDVYRATQPIVCCFMAFIVDLVIIMHRTFRCDQPVGMPAVQGVIEKFKADDRNRVHFEIKSFMERYGTFGALTKKDAVLEKMKDLIYQHTIRQQSGSR